MKSLKQGKYERWLGQRQNWFEDCFGAVYTKLFCYTDSIMRLRTRSNKRKIGLVILVIFKLWYRLVSELFCRQTSSSTHNLYKKFQPDQPRDEPNIGKMIPFFPHSFLRIYVILKLLARPDNSPRPFEDFAEFDDKFFKGWVLNRTQAEGNTSEEKLIDVGLTTLSAVTHNTTHNRQQ